MVPLTDRAAPRENLFDVAIAEVPAPAQLDHDAP
jgi:hypothetical protein